ncbi:MAG: hypothetical protein JSY10_12105 [Paenibacillus sp.]|nr:hypothetical protein [Paenibacillus sp.]
MVQGLFSKSDLVRIISVSKKGLMGNGGGEDKQAGFGGTVGAFLFEEIFFAWFRHVCAKKNTGDKSLT